MQRAITFLIAICCFAPLSVTAQEQANEALAERLIELARLDRVAEQLELALQTGMQSSLQQMVQQGQIEASDEELRKITVILEDEFGITMRDMIPELSDMMVSFYAERLTVDELSELVAIYERPILGKLQDLLPEMSERSTEIALKYQTQMANRLTERLQDLEKR